MSKTKGTNLFSKAVLTFFSLLVFFSVSTVQAQTPQEQLGDFLYNDLELSEPAGQGCVSCHHPDFGFADPDQHLPVSEGVIPGRFGNRNSPSAAYALFFPEFTLKGGIQGGQFWDGRAATLAEQAKGPFLNPVEMNNSSREQVIDKISFRPYASLFEQVCGPNAFDTNDLAIVEASYNCMADAIAAFEMTFIFREFTSKFDAVEAGLAEFTALEEEGRALYEGRGKCGHCHPSKAGGNDPVVFTDFKYHNIGIPSNQEVLRLTNDPTFIDLGLGGRVDISLPKEAGRFKTNHLRDIELTPPYMHNGVLRTLKQVVHFYNTRDVLDVCVDSDDPGFGIDCWPAPEVPDNLDSSFVGDLGLTDAEEDAIVAFMLTFTDGYMSP